jgi:alpha/beta hydrolase fold
MVLPPLVASPDAGSLAAVLRGLGGHRQRQAFVGTAHTVIDWRGQTVSASRQLGLLRDVPVLVAWGAKDATIPPHHHESFAERVPHAVLVEIPDAGHYLHETAADQLFAAMEAFLATTPFQYSEARWTDLVTAPQTQSMSAGTTETAAVRDARPDKVIAARRNIDMAIGALRELRGCTEAEAVRELTLAGRETGLGTRRIALAPLNVLAYENGGAADPDRVVAVSRWRHLLGARTASKPISGDSPAAASDIRVRIRRGERLHSVLALCKYGPALRQHKYTAGVSGRRTKRVSD